MSDKQIVHEFMLDNGDKWFLNRASFGHIWLTNNRNNRRTDLGLDNGAQLLAQELARLAEWNEKLEAAVGAFKKRDVLAVEYNKIPRNRTGSNIMEIGIVSRKLKDATDALKQALDALEVKE